MSAATSTSATGTPGPGTPANGATDSAADRRAVLPDLVRMRRERRDRLLAAMEAEVLDALVLGRAASINYVTGARQLWLSGSRPFGPACVVVAATGGVHLLSTWDDEIPAEIPHDHLYGSSWNGEILMGDLAAIPGLAAARRVGSDSSSAEFGPMLAALAPGAVAVDGTRALQRARQTKTADEVACIEAAIVIAEASLSAMLAALEVGVTERHLLSVHAAALADHGVPALPSDAVAFASPRVGPVHLRHLVDDRPIGPGQLVALHPSALYLGYEGGVGRSAVAGGGVAGGGVAGGGVAGGGVAGGRAVAGGGGRRGAERLAERCSQALAAVIEGCRAGQTTADLRQAWEASEPAPSLLRVYGTGLGMELPISGWGRADQTALVDGSVLTVEGWAVEEGVGAVLQADVVLIGDGDPRVLTRYGTDLQR